MILSTFYYATLC